MKLSALASQYVAYKQGMGMRFHTEARTLKSFCRIMGDIAMAEITADHVHAYIAGAGPITRFWHRKYEVLRGFYRFATARGHVGRSPLPEIIPKAPEFIPHIFSHEELQRLLDASAGCESPRSKLQPHTWRMLILLLYGAALRISEALSLTLADVDLPAGILTIRESKFYKTRLVPIGPDLSSVLETYVARACQGVFHQAGRGTVPDPQWKPVGAAYSGECFSAATSSGRRVAARQRSLSTAIA